MKKDLSFRINLNAPVQIEDSRDRKSKPVQQEEKKNKRETFTDLFESEPEKAPETPVRDDRFDFTGLIGEPEKVITAYDQLQDIDQAITEAYLKRFAKVALMEKEKFGIPASIILANGLLHSKAGKEMPAAKANNHFAIRCTRDWEGDQMTHQGDCYRSYESAWTSFRDHSFYLTTGSFSHLPKLGEVDYKAWAKGLEKGGYSSQPNLARQLITVIDQYGLAELDGHYD